MNYILFMIILFGDGAQLYHVGEYATIEDCFDRREVLVEQIGRPIINYQVICVAQADSV